MTTQSHNAKLDSLSILSLTNNQLVKATGANTFETISISSYGEAALNSGSALLTSSDLSSYVTNSSLTTALNTTLADYSTTSSINTALGNYLLNVFCTFKDLYLKFSRLAV